MRGVPALLGLLVALPLIAGAPLAAAAQKGSGSGSGTVADTKARPLPTAVSALTAEDIAAGIEAVCAAAHAKLPAARVLLFGILPRRDEKPPRPVITDRVNALLKDRMNGAAWLNYVDIGDQFRLADGSVNKSLFSDGVHVNARGYELLAARIQAEIATK